MTKQQEIEAYHNFIRSLPEASYIRPWLTEVAVEVESLIWSDIIPDLSPRKAQLAALELRETSLAESKEIIRRAQDEAQSIRSEAHRLSEQAVRNAKDALRRIADSI